MDCPLIAEIFLHGDSSESYAILIVTCDRKRLEEKAKSLGIEGTYE